MSYRTSPSFAIGMVEPEFRCLICGAETACMPPLDVRSRCCECLGEHGEYEDGYCIECGEAREYPSYEDDVPLFGVRYGDGPIGTPASAMNGNAAVASAIPENRQAWDIWAAFCERNGHP